MNHTRKILVYEFISAGGLGDSLASSSPPASAEAPSLLAQGVAMRDALVADLLAAGLSVSVADAGLAPLPPDCAAASPLRSGPAAPTDWLAGVAADFDLVWVIAPECGNQLARLRDAVGSQRWIGCDADTLRIATSKRATRERLAAWGIATPHAPGAAARGTPPSTTKATQAVQAHHPRWVLKPDDGAGSEDTRVFADFASARTAFLRAQAAGRSGPLMTLESWIPGTPLSLSLLCRRDGCEVLSVNRQRVAPNAAGQVIYAGVDIQAEPVTPEHLALARRICQALPGLRGFVGIDLVRADDGGLHVIEVNPRLTCAYAGLAQKLGRNLAAEIVSDRGDGTRAAPSPPRDTPHTDEAQGVQTDRPAPEPAQ
ncbi:MAG: ATP-grasp domain-containing protein [Rhodocyclaceae bacterium]